MAWSKGPVNPKYRTPEHRAEVAKHKAQMARDGYLTCTETVCIMASRVILPGMAYAAGHKPNGHEYAGPVHRECNTREAAVRARARQYVSPLRW